MMEKNFEKDSVKMRNIVYKFVYLAENWKDEKANPPD